MATEHTPRMHSAFGLARPAPVIEEMPTPALVAERERATERTRLTRDDIGRMVDRVSAVVKDWIEHPGATRAWLGGPATDETLTRIACHAIGCSAADLRDVELVTVAQVVDAATEHAKTLMAARVWAS